MQPMNRIELKTSARNEPRKRRDRKLKANEFGMMRANVNDWTNEDCDCHIQYDAKYILHTDKLVFFFDVANDA